MQDIQQCGMTMRKAGYILKVSLTPVINHTLDLDQIPAMSDKAVINTLIKLKGIGIWTAENVINFIT